LVAVLLKLPGFRDASTLGEERFSGSGADLTPEFKPYIEDAKTILASRWTSYAMRWQAPSCPKAMAIRAR
jgi:hypothetical protein